MADTTTNGAAGRSAAGKTVVVIDSGWSPAWNTGRLVYQQDFGNGDADARNPDANTHGAMVTASILKDAPDVGIISLKVMPDGINSADGAAMEKALQWVVANAEAYNVVGVNMSLASGSVTAETTTLLSDEFAALAGRKVLTAVAAGNAGNGGATQSVSLFGADPSVLCVSASDGSGGFPTWAQRSAGLTDLCADGTDITLTNLAGQSYRVNGSSFAVPQVTAAVALAQHEATADGGAALSRAEFLSLARSTGTANGPGYVALNTDALLSRLGEDDPSAGGGGTSITVTARGSAAAGVNAHFKLLVDGLKIGEGTAGTTAKPFTFTTGPLADSPHKVQVQFDNDAVVGGQDRNLFVEGISINGHAMAAGDPAVSYDKGALDGRDVAHGQSALWWSGTLVFNADKGFFAPATAMTATATTAIATTAVAAGLDGDEAVWAHRAVASDLHETAGTPAPAAAAAAVGGWEHGWSADPMPSYDVWAEHHAA